MTKIPEGTFTSNELKGFQTRVANCIANDVQPAIIDLRDYVNNEYVKYGRTNPEGMLYSPGGKEHYAACARWETDQDDLGPEEIHELGLREVQKLGEVRRIGLCRAFLMCF